MIHNWFHRFIRKRTKPIQYDYAFKWKRRLSIAYGLLAWNAFGVVIYMMYNGKVDWAHYYGLKTDEEKALSPAKSYASSLGIKNMRVVRVSGFRVVDEYDIVEGKESRLDVNEGIEILNE